jgi:RNA polymerase sigma factor for flagellar operon FliA
MIAPLEYASVAATVASSQEELVERHADLVKRIAYHLVSRMPPSIEVDDLIQAGMLGLLDAARQYSPDRGANFETYAGIRIRGAILDEIRKLDWTPRSVHRNLRQMAQAVREVEGRTGGEAKAAEVARELGVSLEDYHRMLQDAVAARLFSLDGGPGEDDGRRTPADDGAGPAAIAEQAGFKEALVAAIEGLPEREKLVLSLYYDDELNLREIGEVLEVSESRVCQIHGQALVRLRARLKVWLDGD